MADISAITLPNGTTYTLKDTRVDNIGATYASSSETIAFIFNGNEIVTAVVDQDSQTGNLAIS